MRISDWSSDVCSSDLAYDAADYAELSAMLQAVVPPAHRRFLDSFEDMIVEGDYVFVHAGVRPGVALKKQRPGDLRWIREEFLGESGGGSAPVIPGMAVVHGHTIFEKDRKSTRLNSSH